MVIESGPLSTQFIVFLTPARERDENHMRTPNVLPNAQCDLITVHTRHTDIKNTNVGSVSFRHPMI
jgi:hypothetical protein